MAIDPEILQQIRTNDPGVTFLNLVGENIDDSDAIALADALKDNHILTALFLTDNSITAAGATALADALRSNCTLKELFLANNSIGDEGATALADALKENLTLDKLYISIKSIGDAGATSLADMLKDNHTLRELYLGYNTIKNAGFNALVNALRHNHNLTSLSLDSKYTDDTIANTLVGALSKSKNIIFIFPNTDELDAHCVQNQAIATDLIEKMQNDPHNLTRADRQEIRDRVPAIFYVGRLDLRFSEKEILAMITAAGIKPDFGPVTQRVNAVREAQRQAALDDPSQGI